MPLSILDSVKNHTLLVPIGAVMVMTQFGASLSLAEGNAGAGFPKAGASSHVASEPADARSTYLRDVLPIFMGKCARCHNQQSILGNWLDYRTAFGDRQEIKRRVWDSWRGHYYKQTMPAGNGPEAESLAEAERAVIKQWVDAGGVYGVPATQEIPSSKPERIEQGKRVFAAVCTPCHQPTGLGLAGKFPPLAGSDFLNGNKDRAIKILLHGRQGEIVVNGQKFNNSMPSFPLSDADIASALTFVYNSFGNSGKDVTPAEVKALRAQPEDAVPVSAKEIAHASSEPSPFE